MNGEILKNIDVSSPHALKKNICTLTECYKIIKNVGSSTEMERVLEVVACLGVYFKDEIQLFFTTSKCTEEERAYVSQKTLLYSLYNGENIDIEDAFDDDDISKIEFLVYTFNSKYFFDTTLYEQGNSLGKSMVKTIDYNHFMNIIRTLEIEKEDLEEDSSFIEFALTNKLDIFHEFGIQFQDTLYNYDSIINYCLKNKINIQHLDFSLLKNQINHIDANSNSVLMNFIKHSQKSRNIDSLLNFLNVEGLNYNYQNKDGNTAFHIFISLLDNYKKIYVETTMQHIFELFLKNTDTSIINTVRDICPGNYLKYFTDHELSVPINTFLTTECSICLSSMIDSGQVLTLRCGHIFHNECVVKCKCCPLCRQ